MQKKKIFSVFLCFCVVCTCGCDFIYRLLQRSGAEEKDILGEIIAYESNSRVAEVQRLLSLYGYRVGKIDGVLGVMTRDAVAAFQADNELKVSRFVDKATWETLHMFDTYGIVVDGELDIKVIQTALEAAGVKPGPLDGKMGRRTKEAIIQFQTQAELKPDGNIGLKTLKELIKYLPDLTEP